MIGIGDRWTVVVIVTDTVGVGVGTVRRAVCVRVVAVRACAETVTIGIGSLRHRRWDHEQNSEGCSKKDEKRSGNG